jgi:hypothetical protein
MFKFGLSSACGICCDINIIVLWLIYMKSLDLELPMHNKCCQHPLQSLQHLFALLTNAYVYVAVGPCNATYCNVYQMRWYRPLQRLLAFLATHISIAKGVVLL